MCVELRGRQVCVMELTSVTAWRVFTDVYPCLRALFHRTGTVTEVLCEWGYCGGLSQTVSVNGGIVVDCHRRFL